MWNLRRSEALIISVDPTDERVCAIKRIFDGAAMAAAGNMAVSVF